LFFGIFINDYTRFSAIYVIFNQHGKIGHAGSLLVANLVDAFEISWINYAILIYDIISVAIARFTELIKKKSKRLCKLMNFICITGEHIFGLFK